MLILAVVFVMCQWQLPMVEGTFDLNDQELEMVADHLTQGECRRLVEALHMKHFRLDHSVSGLHEPNTSCIELLFRWNTHEGLKNSFLDLPLRLREIGRPNLAARLSTMVYHEKSEEVKLSLLNDPFKDLVHTDSPLLEESPPGEHNIPAPPTMNTVWTGWHTFCVILMLFSVLVIVGISLKYLMPADMTTNKLFGGDDSKLAYKLIIEGMPPSPDNSDYNI